MITVLLLTGALGIAQGDRPGRLTDLDGNYCLETGYCRPVEDDYRTPPGGALFAATALVGFGVIRLARRR